MTPYEVSSCAGIVEFKSVLHLCPLQQKERHDEIVIETLECGTSIALHQPVAKTHDSVNGNNSLTCDKLEFHFDNVIPSQATPTTAYYMVGQPVALRAMMPFKSNLNTIKSSTTNTSHLIVCMGLEALETSFISNIPQLKQKENTDGILPRILDSLYLQSNHHINHVHEREMIFGVNMTILMIKESKSNPVDVQIYDLLQYDSGRSASNVNQIRSGMKNQWRYTASIKSFAQVTIQQNAISRDYELTNVVPQFCTSACMAGEKLQLVRKRERQFCNKNYQYHKFISLQPMLMSGGSRKILLRGDNITILETKFDPIHRVERLNDGVVRVQGYKAVLSCLKTILNKKTECYKVPYLQHELTMLLQPFFSSRYTSVSVNLLVTISPSVRDYEHKKLLLSEVQHFNHTSRNGVRKDKNVFKPKIKKPVQNEKCISQYFCENNIISRGENALCKAVPYNNAVDNNCKRKTPSMDLSSATFVDPLLPPTASFCDLASAPVEHIIRQPLSATHNKMKSPCCAKDMETFELGNNKSVTITSIHDNLVLRKTNVSTESKRSLLVSETRKTIAEPMNGSIWTNQNYIVPRPCTMNAIESSAEKNVSLSSTNTHFDDPLFKYMEMLHNRH